MQGDKNRMSKNINTARVGYASSVWKRAQVQKQKKSRLTIKGGKDQGSEKV